MFRLVRRISSRKKSVDLGGAVIYKGQLLGSESWLYSVQAGFCKDAVGNVQKAVLKLPYSSAYLSASETRDLVQQEVKVFKKLDGSCPNVVRCLGGRFGEFDWFSNGIGHFDVEGGEDAFIVLERLCYSLDDLLRGQVGHSDGITYRKLVRIFIEIAEGLDQLHAHGIQHGNLKPSNVLIDEEGTAKLTDFRPLQLMRRETIEAIHRTNGTFPYLAPELAVQLKKGKRLTPTWELDIGSLGLMMLKCFSCDLGTKKGPEDIRHLVSGCCRLDLDGGGSKFPRPTAANVATQLRIILKAPWIDDPLPIVNQVHQPSGCSNASELPDTPIEHRMWAGCCSIVDRRPRLESKGYSVIYQGCYEGHYKDFNGSVHKVAIKLADKFLHLANAVPIPEELKIYDRIGNEHPNVVRCFGGNFSNSPWTIENLEQIKLQNEKNFLVLELVPKSLHQLLVEDEVFPRTCTYKRLIRIFIDIARGLLHLQKHHVPHRELELSKILIDVNGTAKIAASSLTGITLNRSLFQALQGAPNSMKLQFINLIGESVGKSGMIEIVLYGNLLRDCLTCNPLVEGVEMGEGMTLWEVIKDCVGNGRDGRTNFSRVIVRLQSMLEQSWTDERVPWVRK